MADRFPLIANSSSNQIQEIASGDGLDLTGNNIVGAVNVKTTGIATIANTTTSTSTTTGALIVSGGVGIAKSVFIGGNLGVAGTVTYEDVTNVDAVGLITAQSGIKLTGGEITLGTGATAFSPGTNILTVGTASTEVVRVTAKAGIHLNNGSLVERVKINGTALNSATDCIVDDGNVFYRSANLGAASVKPNIRSSVGLNTEMAIGDAISVTIITAVNSTSNFCSSLAIDGKNTGITTHWVGGIPTAGGSTGVDTYSFNILKTADATFVVVANQSKSE